MGCLASLFPQVGPSLIEASPKRLAAVCAANQRFAESAYPLVKRVSSVVISSSLTLENRPFPQICVPFVAAELRKRVG